MNKNYCRPKAPVSCEIEIKNSRFIGLLAPAFSSADCSELLTQARLTWPKASHYCTASILGSPLSSQQQASSDDGEPSGTAGRPMLNVLQHAPIGDVAVVVVRYFGGVKLGTGGLQRAYSQTVAEAINQVSLVEVIFREHYRISYPYQLQGEIESLWQRFDVTLDNSQFSDHVSQQVAIIPSQREAIQQRLDAVSQGQIKLIAVN